MRQRVEGTLNGDHLQLDAQSDLVGVEKPVLGVVHPPAASVGETRERLDRGDGARVEPDDRLVHDSWAAGVDEIADRRPHLAARLPHMSQIEQGVTEKRGRQAQELVVAFL
ncbi:hypothetical protein BCD49_30780 [Pseudofrankia sp. EUN1h]|nr:hypothetical protein BCD49_30780 [Pseudofrankia sp. EUN1h]